MINKKNTLPKELLEVLACPVCKHGLKFNDPKTKLVCSKCSIEYDIKDGIPILLPNKK